MKFTKSEMETVHQYAAPTKAETIAGMERDVSRIDDPLTKAIVEGTIRKLERIPEPECSRVIAAVKSQPAEWPTGSVRQKLAAAKVQSAIIQGHDLSGKERFLPETRHMVTFEVNRDCFVGSKGERFRLYLSDESYQNAKRSERDGEIKITSHAAVINGNLYPDKKARQQER